MSNKFTAIWQAPTPRQREWVAEIFGPYIAENVYDGKREVVLDNAILFDAFIFLYDESYYKRFKGKNAFLVHLVDEYYSGPYQIYENFKGVYRNHWTDVFNPTYVKTLPLGYNAGFDMTLPIPAASSRRFIWSFAGQIGKSSRPDAIRALSKAEPHFVFATDEAAGYLSWPAALPRSLAMPEYQRSMLDAVFRPCPMGNVNIECHHFYEALECGSIPIVERRLTLDYYRDMLGPHPVPTIRSWGEARALVAELLADPARLDALQAECMAWWAAKKVELRKEAGVFLAARTADPAPRTAAMFEPKANTRLWRWTELLRHHNLEALWRRATLTVKRLVFEGRIRVAYRRGQKA